MPGEVKTGSLDLRRSAIRHVALKRRNPFFASQRIALQDKDFGRSPGERFVASEAFQIAAQLAEDGIAAIARVVGVGMGLLIGLTLAIYLLVILVVAAGFLLLTDRSFSIGAFLFNQSWRHYMGWILSGVAAFLCPYLLLGIPIDLALHFSRPIHHLFFARKMLRELERDSDNDDPAARLSVWVNTRHYNMENRSFSRLVESILWIIAGITIAFSGVWTTACCVILYLKLGTMILNQGGWLAAIIVIYVGLHFPYKFLHPKMGIRAVEELINALFQGAPYCEALRQALSKF